MYNPDMGVSLVNSRDFSAIPLGPNFGPNDNYPVFIPNLLLWIPNSWINSNFAFEFRLNSHSFTFSIRVLTLEGD
jgi:hypothetical protein